MSDLLRVLPEELRAAASDLLQLSGEVSHVQSAVRHHWGRLDTGWQSYARAGVDAQYDETVREIERMAVMLEQLGAALVKTAEIIAAADRDAAGFFTVEEVKSGGGKAPGLAKLMPDGTTTPQWEQEGFGWWAEAFEREHGRPPTAEDYNEFRLAYLLSGGGEVQWTEADWVAFYYARQAGLEEWLKTEVPWPMTGQEVLAWVEALNAKHQVTEPVAETAPVVAPPGAPMYVTGAGNTGLNLRETPEIRDDNRVLDSGIPDGAEVYVDPDRPAEEANGHTWRYVTYTDAEGNEYSGWVATAYLEETKSDEGTSEDASTTPTPTPIPTPASTGAPGSIQLEDGVTPESYDSCVLYAMDRRSDLPSPGGSAAGYIDGGYTTEVAEVANAATDLTTVMAVGYAIVWNRGQGYADPTHGHIAVVERVESHRVWVSEANWGDGGRWISRDELLSLHMIGELL